MLHAVDELAKVALPLLPGPTSSIYGALDPDRDVALLAGEVRSGDLDLDSLVSHRITPSTTEVFARMGAGLRSLIDFGAGGS